jgi:hypothetical protein
MQLCEKRGCDGVDRAAPVWHDDSIVALRCPVLAFTPDVEEWIDRFEDTHQMMGGSLVRTDLPAAGTLAEQDSRTMEALDVLRHTVDAIIATARTRAQAERRRRG